MKKSSKLFFISIGLFLLAGSFSPHIVSAKETMKVFVSILPQKYFVEKIGQGLVDVSVMVPPGASPATYEPKPKQMVGLSRARLYFTIGVPFERTWLKKLETANPKMRLVHTDHGIKKRAMKAHHNHGERGKREKVILDPHIWTSPPLVIMQARNILTGILQVDPSNGTVYEANYRKFITEILDLDADLRNVFKGRQGLQFMVFHPSWGYFANAYGLRQVPIEMEGKEPKPAQLKELIANARKHDIKVVFVQPQFSSRSAQLIAREIGGHVLTADPLAENWMENLRHLAERFRTALR